MTGDADVRPTATGVRRWVSEYTVTAVAGANENWIGFDLFSITVVRTDIDRWAVRLRSRCLNRRGEWDPEPIPGMRSAEWLDEHRFNLDTALKYAELAAPNVTVNGWLPDGTRAAHWPQEAV